MKHYELYITHVGKYFTSLKRSSLNDCISIAKMSKPLRQTANQRLRQRGLCFFSRILKFNKRHYTIACRDFCSEFPNTQCLIFAQTSVENSVLLKCRNSEEKTRRLRIRSSAEFLYSMTCVVICSHRRSHLSHFYRVSYRYFWRRDS